MNTKPEKQSVAIVIWDSNHKNILLVKRPLNDQNLPGNWGFPAASKNEPSETWEDVAIKAGKIKLGVQVKIVRYLGEDTIDRGNFILKLRDYEVEIISGIPKVPQPLEGVTQYDEMQYTNQIEELIISTKKGSLCTRIFLKDLGIDYNNPSRSEI